MDLDGVRAEFPGLQNCTYLNTAACSLMPLKVVDALQGYVSERVYRGSTVWKEGWEATQAKTRASVARLIGAKPEEIALVDSASYGMNMAAHLLGHEGPVLANEAYEFPATTLPWKNAGVTIQSVQARGRVIAHDDMYAAATKETATVVTSHVQYCTGFRQEIDAVGATAAARDLNFVVNGTQSLGAIDLDVKRCNADIVIGDGFKWLLSPPGGTGIFFIRNELLQRSKPLFYSWRGQAKPWQFEGDIAMSPTASRFELGVPAYGNLAALGAAVDYIEKIGIRNIEGRVLDLSGRMIDGLADQGFDVVTPKEHRAGIVVFKVDDPVAVEKRLAERNIIVSTRPEGLRASVHFYNNERDVDTLLEALREMRAAPHAMSAAPAGR